MRDIPAPMEARLVDTLPDEPGWQFEPKWDGFRALASRDGDRIEILSKSGKSLARYFPEVVEMLRATRERHFLIDGELIIPIGDFLSFDALQARLHPAESRIRKLARETPAQLMAFDCLQLGDDDLIGAPLSARRAALIGFHAANARAALLLSPASDRIEDARRWLASSGAALDGVVAKRTDDRYRPGERSMVKVKQHRSADCVVGGFRWTKAGDAVASLLLGLYDDVGKLDHVGFCSGFSTDDRRALADRLTALGTGDGFTGKAPGGPSRWNKGEANAFVSLPPALVIEVLYDQVTGQRFRHGTRFLRWRPDKAPSQCRMEQLIHELRPAELATVADG